MNISCVVISSFLDSVVDTVRHIYIYIIWGHQPGHTKREVSRGLFFQVCFFHYKIKATCWYLITPYTPTLFSRKRHMYCYPQPLLMYPGLTIWWFLLSISRPCRNATTVVAAIVQEETRTTAPDRTGQGHQHRHDHEYQE